MLRWLRGMINPLMLPFSTVNHTHKRRRFVEESETVTTESDAASSENWYAGYGTITLDHPDTTAIKSHLKEQGYPLLHNTSPGGGGGGGAMITRGNLVFDTGGSGSGHNNREGTITTEIGQGAGHAQAGYILYQNGFMRVYPLAGLMTGGGSYSVIDEPDIGDDKILETSGTAQISGYVGLGVDFILTAGKMRFLLGFRLGYRLLRLNLNQNQQGPQAKPIIFRVVAGGGRSAQ